MSTGLSERRLKKAVVRRARELGHQIRARAVTLELAPDEVVPGYRLFRAWWGPGERGGAVSGLLEEGQPPDTWPQRALSKLFRRWLERDGELPEPTLVARTAAYLYDPLGRKTVILSPADLDEHTARSGRSSGAHLPRAVAGDDGPGVAFCWVGPTGPSEVHFYLDKKGDVWSRETRLQDLE